MNPRLSSQPRKWWYVVALGRELGRKPLAVRLIDLPLVLYRDKEGRPVAQLDRCPHRNVPLSAGRCLDDNSLECPYHGWRFAPSGQCSHIPGLVGGPKSTHRVPCFATYECQDFVWVCPDEDAEVPEQDPQLVKERSSLQYQSIIRKVQFPAGMHAVVENALDVPHTSILHRGLFRSGERNRVKVIMRRFRTQAEAEYIGEPPPGGLVARLLGLGGAAEKCVEHWDRFFLPGVLQVEYRLGAKSHFLITGYCCPDGSQKTTLFVVACVRTPFPAWINRLLLWSIEPLAMRVFRQDVQILEKQTKSIEAFDGERFMSTELDVLGAPITRLLKDARSRELPRESPDHEGPEARENASASEVEPREVICFEIDA